ncbi:MAG: FAD-dependent oxidoreductase [Psittacicella sp.]
MKTKLVLVGLGLGTFSVLEKIIESNNSLFDITVIAKEPTIAYNRINIVKLLSGSTVEDITFKDLKWYEENNIKLYLNDSLAKIDSENKVVITKLKETISYDKLVLSTGSNVDTPLIPGVRLKQCFGFRNIADMSSIVEASSQFNSISVIGAGFLGLEISHALSILGKRVTLIEKEDHIFPNELNKKAGDILQRDVESFGTRVLLSKEIKSIESEDAKVKSIRFLDGSFISTDMVILATGIKPAVEYARMSKLELGSKGIKVNTSFETNIKDVYAIGECAEINSYIFTSISSLRDQVEAFCSDLLDQDSKAFSISKENGILFKTSGRFIFSAGKFNSNEVIEVENTCDNEYSKLFFKANRLIGAILVGDVSGSDRYLEMINEKLDLSDLSKVSILGIGQEQQNNEDSLDEIICNCNQVTKGEIIKAIKEGAITVEKVGEVTAAGTSCGGCQSKIMTIIKSV